MLYIYQRRYTPNPKRISTIICKLSPIENSLYNTIPYIVTYAKKLGILIKKGIVTYSTTWKLFSKKAQLKIIKNLKKSWEII